MLHCLPRFMRLLFLALLLAGPQFAQTQDKPLPRKIDEFTNTNWSNTIARLDSLASALQETPSAQGYIIAYRPVCDLPGKSGMKVRMAKIYMTNSRGLDPNRIITIDGGAALVPAVVFELWVAPPGIVPQIRADVYKNDLNLYQRTAKYDEHYPETGYDYDYGLEPRLDGFGEILQQNPKLRAYIIGYNGTEEPLAMMVAKPLRDEKSYLNKTFGIPRQRIVTINGGYRKYALIELWLVPPDDAAPQPLSLPLKRKR